MNSTQLDLSLLLPGHPEEKDACVHRLEGLLAQRRGVEQAHLTQENGKARLCLHYDPGLVALEDLEWAAREAGALVQERYRHETMEITGMHCADCAGSLEGVVGRLPGMLAVSASYATEKMSVTYDQSAVGRARIVQEVVSLGYGVKDAAQAEEEDADHRKKPFALPLELSLSFIAGLSWLVGELGERFLDLPRPFAVATYLLAYATGGYHVTRHALKAALKRRFDIDVLMVVAALGAASLGKFAEGALLLFLFSLGHALERYAMDRARGAIRALGKLTPKTARVRRNGLEEEVPVKALRVGDQVVVRSGERLPADGQVLEGSSLVDQSPITGESLPLEKAAGDVVFAGTINGDGTLVIETSKSPEDTTLSRVIRLVEQAQTAKSPTQRFTERFEWVFVPVILAVTAALVVLPPLFGFPFAESFIRAMTLLVAASPCALALATPSAVLSGIARAARSGVLIKGGVHLENAGTATVIAFDKTGTLTEGRPRVTDLVATAGLGEEGLLALAAGVEARASHPLGEAIVRAAEAKKLKLPEAEAVEAVKGKGIRAQVGGSTVLIGTERLLAEAGLALQGPVAEEKERLEGEGKTAMLVASKGEVLGLIAVRDEPRQAARAAIQDLKQRGIQRVVVLTGDNRRVAEAIARELGVDEAKAELLPEDKVAAIRELKRRYGKVIMVGDGVNDAPAMVESTVGVAMGGAGTDVALETADIALMADNLSRLPYAIALSRASRRMIQQNLFISLGVIALLIPSAILGLATISLAIIVHEGSTLLVVANALRLLGFRDCPSGQLPAISEAAPVRR